MATQTRIFPAAARKMIVAKNVATCWVKDEIQEGSRNEKKRRKTENNEYFMALWARKRHREGGVCGRSEEGRNKSKNHCCFGAKLLRIKQFSSFNWEMCLSDVTGPLKCFRINFFDEFFPGAFDPELPCNFLPKIDITHTQIPSNQPRAGLFCLGRLSSLHFLFTHWQRSCLKGFSANSKALMAKSQQPKQIDRAIQVSERSA